MAFIANPETCFSFMYVIEFLTNWSVRQGIKWNVKTYYFCRFGYAAMVQF